jgi:hypothetical protein
MTVIDHADRDDALGQASLNQDVVVALETCSDCGNEWTLQSSADSSVLTVQENLEKCRPEIHDIHHDVIAGKIQEKGSIHSIWPCTSSIRFHSSKQRQDNLDFRVQSVRIFIAI